MEAHKLNELRFEKMKGRKSREGTAGRVVPEGLMRLLTADAAFFSEVEVPVSLAPRIPRPVAIVLCGVITSLFLTADSQCPEAALACSCLGGLQLTYPLRGSLSIPDLSVLPPGSSFWTRATNPFGRGEPCEER